MTEQIFDLTDESNDQRVVFVLLESGPSSYGTVQGVFDNYETPLKHVHAWAVGFQARTPDDLVRKNYHGFQPFNDRYIGGVLFEGNRSYSQWVEIWRVQS